MKIEHINGLVAAPFTPMKPDGSLNLELIPTYYQILKSEGVVGAFICGSTGEGPSLTFKEKMLMIKAWTDCVKKGDDFKIIPLLGGTCISECVELAQYAAATGVHGVSITAPYYFKIGSIDTLAEICRTVAGSIPSTPFYYYHIPVLTGVDFQMINLLERVDDIPNFAGIKYTHEDFMDFLSCLNYKGNTYDMLWGRDENLLSALVLGAKGGVGSTYNYAAPLYHDLIALYNQGKLEAAQKRQQQSIDMIRLLGKYGGIATGKAYMKLMGLDCGEFRLPVKNMSAAQFESFKRDVDHLNFKSFCTPIPAAYRSSQ
ncbi:MAG: dihydrodipicolinate synthetase [Bacteroidetes bacterium CHB5]|nr:dihydrodipicolinate synthetase [Bacteroidetes bacterium CHB5]